ncbi:hypothetical protein H6S82_12730 [Planktothrix sp. FACHB-1355]|uniref:DUF6883 domain-containing protein n=1 Tax=Aerosakkonema funiforme FACHB-1375 TaxID=2949571 RepID=A0A926ZID1_9CYAN|nr:DUF6883 domain-containing protein [Aerosakkonema funiforme]MBD2183127.1 hypothetical protein [Aerosakkonema funiforme FACHB-1375]MBD3559722.1 hypothetical protein [Planktothrix sp. FACHB-1355]
MTYLNPNAVIPEAKLTRYLLVWKPKDDKSGFLAQAGYTLDNWQQLERDLRSLLMNEATLDKESPFGNIYKIEGVLVGSNGVSLQVATFWIVDSFSNETRFVTLLPN